MKKTIYLLLLALVIVFSSCTLHIPYGPYDQPYRTVRVVLHIEPDDAQVLLNGRYVGEAFEFSTTDSAMRLRSRDSEIIIKKEGYIEEVIDLYDYSSQNIAVNLKLRKDKGYVREKPVTERSLPTKPIPKTVKEKDFAEEPEDVNVKKFRLIKIILDIQPPEAAIYLNGKFWGISPAKGKIENLRLKPGKHTLEIVKPGYQAYKKQLDLSDQKELNLSIKLQK